VLHCIQVPVTATNDFPCSQITLHLLSGHCSQFHSPIFRYLFQMSCPCQNVLMSTTND
jgi:hypothetical protein